MLAVSVRSGKVEVVEVPRPQIHHPADAIVMVTTAAIGRWETGWEDNGPSAIGAPGAQFAGIVVEVGADVAIADVDDLVVATCSGFLSDGRRVRFGHGSLRGGHAEYVLVRQADQVLVSTTPAAEERAVFAGGEAALGIRAAERAMRAVGDGPIAVWGCDAAGLTAIAWIRHRRGRASNTFAFDRHPASLAAAKSLGAREFDEEAIAGFDGAVVVPTHAEPPVPDHLPVFPTAVIYRDDGADRPTLEETRRAETAIRLRQIDLTPLVSTVLPLDQAAEAYQLATERPPGVRSVLLKP